MSKHKIHKQEVYAFEIVYRMNIWTENRKEKMERMIIQVYFTFNSFNLSVFAANAAAFVSISSSMCNNSMLRFVRFVSCSNNESYFDLWKDAAFSLN